MAWRFRFRNARSFDVRDAGARATWLCEVEVEPVDIGLLLQVLGLQPSETVEYKVFFAGEEILSRTVTANEEGVAVHGLTSVAASRVGVDRVTATAESCEVEAEFHVPLPDTAAASTTVAEHRPIDVLLVVFAAVSVFAYLLNPFRRLAFKHD